MSGSTGHDTHFWNQVLMIAEAIAASDDSLESMGDHLLALELGFEDRIDPVEDFRSYATLRLCRSIRRQLERAGSQAD